MFCLTQAPELFVGLERANGRQMLMGLTDPWKTDVFSFGFLLFEWCVLPYCMHLIKAMMQCYLQARTCLSLSGRG